MRHGHGRAPVYQTPAGIILLAWLARFVFRLLRLVFRHPVAATALALLTVLWFTITWIGLVAMVAWTVLVLVIWRCFWPMGFARWVATLARNTRRAWVYRRRWHAVMTIADLAPSTAAGSSCPSWSRSPPPATSTA